MYVLGLTTMGESAAALFWNGELVHAAEEERFSRKKHHIGFPREAIGSCLANAGISMAQVDHIAHYWRPWMLGHRIGHTIPILLKSPRLFRARAKRGSEQGGGHYRRMFQLRSLRKGERRYPLRRAPSRSCGERFLCLAVREGRDSDSRRSR